MAAYRKVESWWTVKFAAGVPLEQFLAAMNHFTMAWHSRWRFSFTSREISHAIGSYRARKDRRCRVGHLDGGMRRWWQRWRRRCGDGPDGGRIDGYGLGVGRRDRCRSHRQ